MCKTYLNGDGKTAHGFSDDCSQTAQVGATASSTSCVEVAACLQVLFAIVTLTLSTLTRQSLLCEEELPVGGNCKLFGVIEDATTVEVETSSSRMSSISPMTSSSAWATSCIRRLKKPRRRGLTLIGSVLRVSLRTTAILEVMSSAAASAFSGWSVFPGELPGARL